MMRANSTSDPSNTATPDGTAAFAGAIPLPDDLLSRNWGWFVARGVLLILLGVVALLAPGVAMFTFAMVFAAFCLADGAMAVVSGVRGARHRDQSWGALVLAGIFGLAVGVLFILFPLLSTLAYALTTAFLIVFWAIATGVFQIAAAIRLRKVIEGEWLLALSGALSVLLGGLIAFWIAVDPLVSVLSVAWLIAIYALIAGVALTVLGLRLRKRARGTAAEAPAPRSA